MELWLCVAVKLLCAWEALGRVCRFARRDCVRITAPCLENGVDIPCSNTQYFGVIDQWTVQYNGSSRTIALAKLRGRVGLMLCAAVNLSRVWEALVCPGSRAAIVFGLLRLA